MSVDPHPICASIHLPTNDKPTKRCLSTTKLANQRETDEFIGVSFGNAKMEKMGDVSAPINATLSQSLQCKNGLVATVHRAFASEIPLALSPDCIWAAIAQAISIHCNQNAEELRQVFVEHKSKEVIQVVHNGLVFGNQNSPWEEVFPVFQEAVKKSIKVPQFADAMSAHFTTTGQPESISHTLALMDSVKEYFSYRVLTMCGIPRIDLLGTAQDWIKLRENAEFAIKTVQMDWWLDELLPVLDHFVALSTRQVDLQQAKVFWDRIYYMGGSCSSGVEPYCTGWLLVFFPFQKSTRENEEFQKRRCGATCSFESLMDVEFWQKRRRDSLMGHEDKKDLWGSGSYGIEYECIPSGISKVPFEWDYQPSGQIYNMNMFGGFVSAIGQHGKDAITPIMGWAVAHN